MDAERTHDVELLRRVAGEDNAAFAELFDRHAASVLGLLVRMFGRRSDAEELLQDTFLQVWQRAASYRPEGCAPRSWLLMLARSRAIDRLRARRARAERERESVRETVRSAALDGRPAQMPAALDRLADDERRRRVARALRSLPDEQRHAIELAFFKGLTHRQVAERLAQPLGTVKSRILLGMKKLREQLGSEAAP